uniref:competence protein CoiA n=1 Tax=Pseudorhizobium flavum TaxID=1335061 RepID=UPI00376F4D20
MPLRCLNADGSSIHAFDLTETQWQELVDDNRKHRHLRMPCCDAKVSLKRRKSTRFFAHKAVGACTTAPETETHLVLKKLAVEAARATGWTAEAEVRGQTPDGEPWIADVLAEKNGSEVAIEIQWSGQTPDETMRRQERYKASGVRGLWIFRRPGFPITHDLPAVCIGGELNEGLTASIPGPWKQSLPMKDFLTAAFDRRFKFGLQPDQIADLQIWTGTMDCWSCGCETRIIHHVEFTVLGQRGNFGIAELEQYRVLGPLLPHLTAIPGVGAIKRRFSGTMQSRYMSNGCSHCDALIGQHFEYQAERDDAPAITLQVPITPEWKAAMDDYGWDVTWWVDVP